MSLAVADMSGPESGGEVPPPSQLGEKAQQAATVKAEKSSVPARAAEILSRTVPVRALPGHEGCDDSDVDGPEAKGRPNFIKDAILKALCTSHHLSYEFLAISNCRR